ncbi:hypothetical protein VTL71DRAFT_640 [Oculimacula yallundae]|uniref:Uncharacterized protein n=1 Tax=Oculimacula yallundae TaxID=86028 RepID=A0ABR4D0M8_9HELO
MASFFTKSSKTQEVFEFYDFHFVLPKKVLSANAAPLVFPVYLSPKETQTRNKSTHKLKKRPARHLAMCN